ncbi:bifunctional acetyl transferase/isomerase domain protein, partial [Bacteroides fragilis str. 34-F-2 
MMFQEENHVGDMHIEKMKNLLWLYPGALMWFWM